MCSHKGKKVYFHATHPSKFHLNQNGKSKLSIIVGVCLIYYCLKHSCSSVSKNGKEKKVTQPNALKICQHVDVTSL